MPIPGQDIVDPRLRQCLHRGVDLLDGQRLGALVVAAGRVGLVLERYHAGNPLSGP